MCDLPNKLLVCTMHDCETGSWKWGAAAICTSNQCKNYVVPTQGPHSHILMMGGGSDCFFGVWNFGPKWFFWVYERCRHFFGLWKKTEGFFWVAKKGLRDFLGYTKRSSDFFGLTNFEVVIFFGYKIWTSVRPSPPSLKFVSGAPGGSRRQTYM